MATRVTSKDQLKVGDLVRVADGHLNGLPFPSRKTFMVMSLCNAVDQTTGLVWEEPHHVKICYVNPSNHDEETNSVKAWEDAPIGTKMSHGLWANVVTGHDLELL